ncbi:hypothetical protein [Acinetobacter proteolyticus]|uniref:Gp5/Type VI secretion system Vgr protein OB-fold domain-containing protein n=1 Tax=Acinetobacter proteolyticus TaxID=1776741 RepID=A0A2N0WIB5_9GAMM|nr:hypothetical protein [Acinetobacter proteolyticus]MBK5646837.1 hypothetical protein [Acinetobacter sp.]PKF35555.1 hypothetical protein CW311_04500 [Acinetobacter proteolyticus]
MSQRTGSGLIYGKFPAEIVSYNGGTRECVIKTPVGDEIDAEIEYPIGDNSRNTEISISKGDKVWCEYIQGDTRRALITGWRNPKKGNSTGTRTFSHANIVLNAKSSIKCIVGGMTFEITSGDVKANGISVINHVHKVIKEGQDTDKPR